MKVDLTRDDAYRVTFASKAAGRDHVVPPLEALRTADDPSLLTTRGDKSTGDWALLTALPEWLTPDDVRPHLENGIRVETLDGGLCVQTLHVGSYDDEVIPTEGLQMTGCRHEISLSDARRVASEKLRTILRQPVERI